MSRFLGNIYKIKFPFTDLSGAKARPGMALSKPDPLGDMSFAFITTKETRSFGRSIDIPDGLLPYTSHLHLDKIFLLNEELILKKIARVPMEFLDLVLKELTSGFHYAFFSHNQTDEKLRCR
jgi:mRNA-degrading endonuclease toxin of MazEF toxin-antitoxin module